MRRSRARAVLTLLLPLLVAVGCSTEYPPARPGNRITGHVSYAGTMKEGLSRPALRVLAVVDFPPSSVPHAVTTIEAPDFSRPVPFTLRNLPAFRYHVVAQLYDIDRPPGNGASPLPFGGWPSFCELTRESSLVTVTDGAPATDVDFSIWDQSGATDPCSKRGGVCPAAGKAALRSQILFGRAAADIMPPDQLIYAVTTGPADRAPVTFRIVEAQQLMFPYTISDASLPPGDYFAYACYDVGGDNLTGCDPVKDFAATWPTNSRLPLPANKITTIKIDLDAHTIGLDKVEDPRDVGCP